jgi:dTDP-4-amino-4,6-dideoxygalactose transaminase
MGGDELRLIHEAFESNYIAPLGPMVDAFEKEFAETVGFRHALALSSGTAAMHLALRHLGIGPGDEVFASDLTFIGSVTPIVFVGATPVFIDSDRSTWNMDPDLLAEELEVCSSRGKLPKAVLVTDVYGQCADYGQIFFICEKYGVPVIIDAAEAMGAYYKRSEERYQKSKDGDQRSEIKDQKTEEPLSWRHAGYGAKAAIYSFNGNKIVTTSGGGMLASDDKGFIDHARKLSQQAREDFPYYEHEEIGYNYRMSNILAAIGLGQLRVLSERVNRKREIFKYYQNALENVPGLELMPEAFYGRSNRWLTAILVTPEEFGADCETVRQALEADNIESRPLFKPMHMQPVFHGRRLNVQISRYRDGRKKKYYARSVGGEVVEDLFSRGLCLPSDTAMNEDDIGRVVNVIIGCRNKKQTVEESIAYAQIRHIADLDALTRVRERRMALYNTMKDSPSAKNNDLTIQMR